MTTLASLESDVRNFIGPGLYDRFFLPAGSTSWVDDGIKFAQRQIASLLGLTRIDKLFFSVNNRFAMPIDAIKVVHAEMRYVSSTGVPMGKVLYESTMAIEDTKNINWRSRTGDPTVWIQASGNTILMNGQPSSSEILVGYIQDPVAMVNPTDTPDVRIPQYFHQFLKYAAAAWLLSQAGQGMDLKKASEHYAKFTACLGLGPLPLASPDVRQ
jgi:hypothetical protein